MVNKGSGKNNVLGEFDLLEKVALACVGKNVDAILEGNPNKRVKVKGKKYELSCSLDEVGKGVHRERFILFALHRSFLFYSTYYAKALILDREGRAIELMADKELESLGIP